ncbi:hypothetical protein [Trichothermofontia sp.]
MATPTEVRKYLACWFQLGKCVFLRNGQGALLPDPVIWGDRYSDAFEECWQRVTAPDAGDCYLEGTQQTIQQLLDAQWELLPCARCTMPVPICSRGVTSVPCPCSDLQGWPNLDLPLPRQPVSTRDHLRDICRRLETAALPPAAHPPELPQALPPTVSPNRIDDLIDEPIGPCPPEESSARSAEAMVYGFTVDIPTMRPNASVPVERRDGAEG